MQRQQLTGPLSTIQSDETRAKEHIRDRKAERKELEEKVPAEIRHYSHTDCGLIPRKQMKKEYIAKLAEDGGARSEAVCMPAHHLSPMLPARSRYL